MRAFVYIGLLSFVIILTACNSLESEENEQLEDLEQEDNPSSVTDEKHQEQRAEVNGKNERNLETEKSSEPSVYEPEEVNGREDPEADGNIVYPEALENLELPYIYMKTHLYIAGRLILIKIFDLSYRCQIQMIRKRLIQMCQTKVILQFLLVEQNSKQMMS